MNQSGIRGLVLASSVLNSGLYFIGCLFLILYLTYYRLEQRPLGCCNNKEGYLITYKNKMRHKYEYLSMLQKYFDELDPALNDFKIKKVQNKKNFYKPGDLITNLYLLIEGEARLIFQQQHFLLPPETLIGDYEPTQSLNRRTSGFQGLKDCVVAVIPFDYFYLIKPSYLEDGQAINKMILMENKRANYLVRKLFKLKNLFRGENLVLEHGLASNDVAVIKEGIFSLKKYLKVAYIKKYQVEVNKEFPLVLLNKGELAYKNLTCESPRGELFVCQGIYLSKLVQRFQQVSRLLSIKCQIKQCLDRREQNIKTTCVGSIEMFRSIVPPIFSPEKPKTERHEQPTPRYLRKNQNFEVNHFSVEKRKNNLVQVVSTNRHYSLMPFTPKKFVTKTKECYKFSHQNLNERRLQILILKQKPERQQKQRSLTQIPDQFDSKFKQKMFIKPTNPFHHSRSYSMPSQQPQSSNSTVQQKDFFVSKTQQETSVKKIKLKQRRQHRHQ